MLFHIVEGAQVVLRSRGVFRQTPVFRRCQQLYAKWGSGFITLSRGGGTSHPYVSWDHIEGVAYTEPRLGPLQHAFAPADNVRQITAR